MISLAVGGLGC